MTSCFENSHGRQRWFGFAGCGRFGLSLAFGILVGFGQGSTPVAAQQPAGEAAPSERVQTPFARGVLIEVPPAPEPEETFSGPFELAELREMHPEISWSGGDHPEGKPYFEARSRTLEEMARQVIFRREVYCLEYSFKPLRQIFLDVPRGDGTSERKLVTYMVFRVRYRGGDLRPAADEVGSGPVFKRIEAISYPSRRAFPILVLENKENGRRFTDKILPSVKQRIAAREQITTNLYNTVEITRIPIPKSSDPDAQGVWGLATWTDLDPDLDFISVDVFGLTNAFEREGLEQDAPFRRKVLSLNFYRPGDAMRQTEDRIRFGVPAYSDPAEQKEVLEQYGLDERLDYRWLFR